jgi:hypothetical protein
MCLIAHRDNPGAHIPNDVIDYNLRSNPDGFGLMWRSTEGLQHVKYAPNQPQEFRAKLKELDKTNVEYAAHWRKATHGAACYDLSHPFEYTDKGGNRMLMMHNGIINIKTKKDESDTLAYVRAVLSRLDYGWWKNKGISYLVEATIGWSRIILMSETTSVIINDEDWRMVNGIYYSTTPLPAYAANKGLVPTPPPPAPKGLRWGHMGHTVEAVGDAKDMDGDDAYGEVMCTVCKTSGEFYVIDGTLFIDVDHIAPGSIADDDDDEFYDEDDEPLLLLS